MIGLLVVGRVDGRSAGKKRKFKWESGVENVKYMVPFLIKLVMMLWILSPRVVFYLVLD